ncbi:MAG: glycosyltransferase family 39 protein [Nitrososphaerales archaeon]
MPDHDEFAYVGNALYYSGLHPNLSGMSFNGEAYSPAFVERPPLFWWLLSSLLALRVNPYFTLAISPLFTILSAIVITEFAYELTGQVKAGLFGGLLAAVSGFSVSVGSHLLSDAMGSFFATVAIYSFYEYFFRNKRVFVLVLGASIGLGLVARDEDLITLLLLIVLWILFVAKGTVFKRFLYLAVFGLIFGIPTLLIGLTNTLQAISNLITPFVLTGWPVVIVIGVIAFFVSYRKTTGYRLADLGSGFTLFFVAMLPFFFDNYYLGNVEYYIAGKGVLARPVSHLLMIPQTGGVGANLPEHVKITDWLTSIPSLLSIGVLAAAAIGIFYLWKSNRRNFALIGLWTLTTMGYVIVGTHLEDRFLLIGFAPMMILAGIGLGFVFNVNRIIGTVAVALSLFLSDLIPRSVLSFSNLTVVAGFASGNHNWMFTFLPTLNLSSRPLPSLPLPYLLEGLASLPIALFLVGIVVATQEIRESPVISSEKKRGVHATNIKQEDEKGDSEIWITEGEKTPEISNATPLETSSGDTRQEIIDTEPEDEEVLSLFGFEHNNSDIKEK